MRDAEDLTHVDVPLYARVAYAYYLGGLTQGEIAKRMRTSRQRINRILAKCLSLGIVEIHIHGESSMFLEQETLLANKYNLRSVRLVEETQDEQEFFVSIGRAAARFMTETLQSGDVIGFSRGRTLSAMLEHLERLELDNLTATQLMGGWNHQAGGIGGDNIVMRFSEIIPSKVNMLYAPVLVNDEELRRGIMREPYFLRSYEVLQSCTVAMLGIAEIKNLSFPQIKQIRPYVPPEAVGEICTRLFDKDGKILKTKIDDRTLAIAPEDLCKIPLRVGVAGMTYKTEAILGALRGQLINALITDTAVAAKLLEA